MKKVVFRSIRHGALKQTRWVLCLLPLLFAACFDSQSSPPEPKNKKQMGIAAISRFFPFSRTLPAEAPETGSIAQVMASGPDSVSAYVYLTDEFAEPGAGIAPFQALEHPLFEDAPTVVEGSLSLPSAAGSERGAYLASITSLVLNGRFTQIFSSLFPPNTGDDLALAARDDLPNPFTEAKQIQVASSASVSPEVSSNAAEQTGSGTTNPNESAKTKPADPMAAAGFATPAAGYFMLLGDFDGSGILQARPAIRSGETLFVANDGERDFSLFVNSAAAERQRAFYIEDMNGDGIPDVLVARRGELFGGVLLGDGTGGYNVANTFFTGYEPTIPCAGPFRDGNREILTVNTRTGVLMTFDAAKGYSVSQKQELAFKPNYLLHLVAQDTFTDYVRIAQVAGKEQILKWGDGGALAATAEVLPADPLVLDGDFGFDSLRAYQVGSYASVVLTSQGRSFNVANLRLFPAIFLVIGDFQGRGQTDVAVGTLELFIPAKTNP